ncbi:MAG: flagellar basal body rod protein FlgB [Inquilinus sp.]|nr:flagellar basal body rod protein FlgB [Inquilinus sp.]
MDFSSIGLFRLVSQRLDWLTRRQDVLAQNIANADTPSYRPRDLRPFAAHLDAATGPVTPAATHPGHIDPVAAGNGAAPSSERQNDVYETAPTGNAVVLEQQMVRVSETAMQHQLALNLYRKHVGMIRLALGRGR